MTATLSDKRAFGNERGEISLVRVGDEDISLGFDLTIIYTHKTCSSSKVAAVGILNH